MGTLAIGVLRAAEISYVLDTAATQIYVLTEPFWAQSPIFQNLDNTTYFEVVYQNPFHFLYRITG